MDALRLRRSLRVLFVTDGRGDVARLERLVAAAIAGGVRGVQLREPSLPDERLAALATRLRAGLAEVDGALFVNDRVELARRGHADGVQLPSRSLPLAPVRAELGAGCVLGASVHDAAELALADGADFVVIAPVLPTASKPTAAALGVVGAMALTALAPCPAVWLGGFDAATLATLGAFDGATRPIGFGLRSALSIDDGAAAARAGAIVAAVAAILGPL